ncbi:hypothetical protein GCM10007304_14250 [Rhodococcoides trifolii]|uniref:Cutinase n=1 Tax=Rhodococcoides trifolii TaxID=908250 RepID=A0A917FR99_9NOCA|nr:cutinase family protein [Rhodococcus trifolii]GGG01421.1 hypothetical protein GCM10007304_14250 [Rhodococcus trifolii]
MNATTLQCRFATVSVALTMLLAVGVAPAHAASPGSSTDCPRIAAEFVPGTWETGNTADPSVSVGLLKPIADELDRRFPGQIRSWFAPYDAQAFTAGVAYATSAADGRQKLNDDIASLAGCTNTRWLIFGYSQGADIAGDVVANIGCGSSPIPADRVLGAGLIADPKQANADGKVVGPQVNGHGIAGARPGGFCSMTSRVAEQCDRADLYCTNDTAKNPILAAVGRMVTQPPGSFGSSAITSSLTSNLSGSQASQLPSDVSEISTQTSRNELTDPDAVAAAATRTANTLSGLSDAASWATANKSLLDPKRTDPGAKQLLAKLNGIDLSAAINNAQSIAHTAGAVASGGELPANVLDQPGRELAAATTPLTSTPSSALGAASGALAVLKPSVVIDQLTNAGTNLVEFTANIPGIIDALRELGQIVIDPALLLPGAAQADLIKKAHALSGDLNHLFEPVVRFAAGADLQVVSKLLQLIPDPSGAAAIASVVVSLLGQVDVIRLANSVGALQEALWHGLETGDWIGAAGRAASAGLELTTVGLSALTGSIKTPDSALGSVSDVGSLASQLTSLMSSPGADALSNIASEGMQAAAFLASGVHVSSYTDKPIDSSGHTSVSWMTEWAAAKIAALT